MGQADLSVCREYAVPLIRRRNRALYRCCGLDTVELIREKEESLVVAFIQSRNLYRTTNRVAEIVVAQRRPRQLGLIGEEVIGIEVIVAEEFIEIAVELVRSRLCHHVDLSAGAAP